MLDPVRTALVVIDMINHQLDPDRGMLPTLRARGVPVDYFADRVRNEVIPNHLALVRACRARGVRVTYSRIGGYATDGADLGPNVRGISSWGTRADTRDCAVIQDLAPEPGDVTLIKTGSGAFTTSSLDTHLRNMGIETVLYTGVITNGCVMLTATAGYDLGYRGILVADCTATTSPRAQGVAEEILSGFTEAIASTSEIIAALDSGTLVTSRPRIHAAEAFRA